MEYGGFEECYRNPFNDVTSNLRLGLTGSALSGEYGLPIHTIDDPDDIFANRPRFERVEDQQGYPLQGSFDYDADGAWFTRGWGNGNRLQQHKNRYGQYVLVHRQ